MNKHNSASSQPKPTREQRARKKRANILRIVALILAVVLLAALVLGTMVNVSASYQDSGDRLYEKLSALRKEKEGLDAQLAEMQAEMASAEEELAVISTQVRLMDQQYSYQAAMTEIYQERVSELRSLLIETQEKELSLYKSMKSVLRAMEEAPKMTFWSVLFGSISMREFLAHLSMMNEVIVYEKEQLRLIQKARTDLSETRYELQVQEANYAESLRELEKQKSEIDQRNQELEELITQLEEEQADIRERLEYITPQVALSEDQKKMTQPLTEEQITAFLVRAEGELENAGLSAYEMDCRLTMLKEGLSLVGKVPYFWGGRSYSPGWNESWTTLQPIQHAGCEAYPLGELFPYGLDCGAFVFWAAMTMYGADSWESPVEWMSPRGATGIFEHDNVRKVAWENKLPGDLVVNTPLTHIGFYLCEGDDGSPLFLHCCGGYGVVVSSSILCNFDRAGSLSF